MNPVRPHMSVIWRALSGRLDESRRDDVSAVDPRAYEVVPAVDQIETHPFHQQVEAQKFLQENAIQMESWGPFAEGKSDIFHNALLKSIGDEHGKSIAQVVLRWLTQRGIVAQPTTCRSVARRFRASFQRDAARRAAGTGRHVAAEWSSVRRATTNYQLRTVNLILLFENDFISAERVRLSGRRLRHVLDVHRAAAGDELTVGVAGGRVGRGRVTTLDAETLEMDVALDRDPPAPLPLTLVLALPRPKVLNRVIAGVASLGVKRVFLVNAWRVEKNYWKSPRLASLRDQAILGLEQAKDTALPSIELRRLFRPFVEDELPAIARGTRALVAHPSASRECPRDVREPVTLAVGPEGGFIAEEIASLERVGFEPVTVGARVLRVETAVAAIIGRLF